MSKATALIESFINESPFQSNVVRVANDNNGIVSSSRSMVVKVRFNSEEDSKRFISEINRKDYLPEVIYSYKGSVVVLVTP